MVKLNVIKAMEEGSADAHNATTNSLLIYSPIFKMNLHFLKRGVLIDSFHACGVELFKPKQGTFIGRRELLLSLLFLFEALTAGWMNTLSPSGPGKEEFHR